MIMGEDILFFWGARMIMAGLALTGDVPFRVLHVHALVRDAERQKMSKTKGNVLDPLEVTRTYGTDATRFALAMSAAPGTDIAFSDDKVEAYRAFANKIWNAGRFILLNLGKLPQPLEAQLGLALEPMPEVGFAAAAGGRNGAAPLALADRWIFSRLASVSSEIGAALDGFRFHEAAFAIYHFFWHEFCDWYLEWVKPEIVQAAQGPRAPAAWINLLRAFKASLHLLHPFMPFITEELWHRLPRSESVPSISLSAFALVGARAADPVSESEFEQIRALVTAVRNVKAERELQREKPSAQVASEDHRALSLFREHQGVILRLAGLESLNFEAGSFPSQAEAIPVTAGISLRLFHEKTVDTAQERSRLEKERAKLEQSLAQISKQLQNREFVNRAPREVVRAAEQRQKELSELLQKVVQALGRVVGA